MGGWMNGAFNGITGSVGVTHVDAVWSGFSKVVKLPAYTLLNAGFHYENAHWKLGMEGKGPDEIARGIEAAYTKGELQRTDSASIAYMFSADMYLGPHLGHGLIYPHLMLFLPYYDNAMLGGNERRSGLPFLSDDPGTPFAVTVIPVDKAFANKAKVK